MRGTVSASRRSTDEVRALVIAAARASFSEKGYRATTRDIAGRAGVAESVIYKQFGSKAELFRVTVVTAFTDVIDRWVTSWEGSSADGDISEMAGSYISALYDMARADARLLRELMAVSDDTDESFIELARQISRHLANSLGRVQRVVRLGAATRGYALDDPLTLAVSTAMVISTAVFDHWFLPDECRDASRERLIREMQTMCLHGITHRPALSGAAGALGQAP